MTDKIDKHKNDYSNPSAAQNHAMSKRKRGYKAEVEIVKHANGKVIYRVRWWR